MKAMTQPPQPTTPIEIAWAQFVEQMGDRKHGMTDAFKFAWKAATEAEREECANIVEAIETYQKIERACFKFAAKTIRART